MSDNENEDEFRKAAVQKRAALMAEADKAGRQAELWTEHRKALRMQVYHLGNYLGLPPAENPSPILEEGLWGLGAPTSGGAAGGILLGSGIFGSSPSASPAARPAVPEWPGASPPAQGVDPAAGTTRAAEAPLRRGQKMLTALAIIASKGTQGASLREIIEEGRRLGVEFLPPSLRSQLSKMGSAPDPKIENRDGRFYFKLGDGAPFSGETIAQLHAIAKGD